MQSLHRQYTWREYLRLAEDSNIKLEYCDGEILAMAGGTPEHARLMARVSTAIGSQLSGRPCEMYSSELRIRVEATGLAAYPDVTVVCGPPRTDPEDRNTIVNPTLVVEVTSDSTERYDRSTKLDNYRQVSSMQEVLFVSHREPLIEVFRRPEGGPPDAEWERQAAGPGEVLTLRSVEAALDVDRIYAGVQLEPQPSP